MSNKFNTEIQKDLAPLFKEAREKGLWFHCNYQDLWFSPDELVKGQSEGHFNWGAANWELRDPMEHLNEINKRIESMRLAKETFLRRIEEAK